MSRPLSFHARWLSRGENALFTTCLAGLTKLARARQDRAVTALVRGLARLTLAYRRSHPVGAEPLALAEEWQRLMPSRKLVPITRVEGDTAYGEIRVECPLRGTGDVEACHRLMEYDRSLMRAHGAHFVVLQSQAEPGVSVCQIAIRQGLLPTEDLIPTLRRVRQAASPGA